MIGVKLWFCIDEQEESLDMIDVGWLMNDDSKSVVLMLPGPI